MQLEDATADESADCVPSCGYLVTADDFSTVKLFNFPTVWDDAPYKAFRGHSSHITDARWAGGGGAQGQRREPPNRDMQGWRSHLKATGGLQATWQAA